MSEMTDFPHHIRNLPRVDFILRSHLRWTDFWHESGICLLTRIVSAGFATVHGNNTLTINAVEAYPLDKFTTEVSSHFSLSVNDKGTWLIIDFSFPLHLSLPRLSIYLSYPS